MGLRINQNIAAMNAYRNLSVTDTQMSKSLEKLSSGYRINRAADDAAGLSISEGLRAQVGGLKVAVRNAQDGVSVVQTAEGALTETHSILQRMRDLAVQSSNSGSQDAAAQSAANQEFGQLKTELDRIANTTSFGTQKLLDGTYGSSYKSTTATAAFSAITVTPATDDSLTLTGATVNGSTQNITATVAGGTYNSPTAYVNAVNAALTTALKAAGGTGTEVQMSANIDPTGAGVSYTLSGAAGFTPGGTLVNNPALAAASAGSGGTFQVGANNNTQEQISVSIAKQDSATLGLTSTSLQDTASSQTAITDIDNAIKQVSDTRASLGAYQNRFEHTINNLNVAVENLSASESRIRDTDMAQEMVSFTRSQILSQAGTAMLAQANQAPQSVLSLLRG